MLGLIYLILCFMFGYVLCLLAFPKLASLTDTSYSGEKIRLCPLFLQLPVWYLCGALPMTWLTYALGYLFRGTEEPLLFANAVLMPIIALVSILGILRHLRKNKVDVSGAVSKITMSEGIFILVVVALVTLLMWWSFFVRGGKLYIGFSIFSDFAPHLGMIRSFSYGNNFPTQYSHYAGQDIKYHFMFQFMVGNLEYLGLRLDYAFNLPSMICMIGAFMLLYVLAVKMTAKRLVGYLACLLFAFRSSQAFFDFVKSVPKGESVVEALKNNTEFIGTTTNESWGLWNLNVYCNQRHLAIGLCVLLFLVIVLMQYVFDAASRIKRCLANEEEKLTQKDPKASLLLPERWFYAAGHSIASTEGWLPKSMREAVGLSLLLGLTCFFNGACVIACLAVLFVMAIVSDRRLEYALVASITVIMTLLATRFFMDGSAVTFQYQFGFLAENPTLFGALDYILKLCGILPFVLLGAFLLQAGVRRWAMLAFAAPFIIAFTLSFTVDITVNHKYIMISLMLLCIPAAAFIEWLWSLRGVWKRAVCILLLFALTITGIYDLSVVLKKNDPREGQCIIYDENDPVTQWIRENTTSQDMFLTSYYSLSPVVLGGAMLYYGWPYYAWSAGYDTDYRHAVVREMYQASTPEQLDYLIQEHNIRYIVVDDEVRYSTEYVVNEENIENTYYSVFEHNGLYIYDTTRRKLIDYGGSDGETVYCNSGLQ